jgi:hypothetical protein
MFGGDEVSAVVIDIGQGTVKAGWAGEDAPKVNSAFMHLLLYMLLPRCDDEFIRKIKLNRSEKH